MVFGPVGSFAGAVFGGVGGYFTGDYLASKLPKTKAEIIALFVEEKLEYYSIIFNEEELKSTTNIFRTV